MTKLNKLTIQFLAPLALVLTAACDDLIIKDDGQVQVGLEDCEGVSFQILVKQSGKPSTSKAVKVEDGQLELDASDAGYDFDQRITVEISAVGPGAEECGIDGVRVFEGTAEKTGIGDHKISLGDFQKR